MPNNTAITLNSPYFTQATRQVIPNRRLVNERYNWSKDEELKTIEEVRDFLRKQRGAMDPRDEVRTLSRCKVTFNAKGVPFIQFIDARGRLIPEIYHFTKRGWTALVKEVFPAGLRDQLAMARTPGAGAKIATLALNIFLAQQDREVLFRTARTKTDVVVDGRSIVNRMIRTVQKSSDIGYTPMDNLEVVESLLSTDCGNARVLEMMIEDEAFALRLALVDNDEMKMDIDNQYPMIQVRNCEVGLGSVRIGGGTIRPWCANGCFSTERTSEIRRPHRGSHERISAAVNNSFSDIVAGAYGVVEKYQEALEVEVDDLVALMEEEYENMAKAYSGFALNETEKDLIVAALEDETTHDPGLLAAGVDAITFAAKALPLNRQNDLEKIAFEFMARSLERAEERKIILA